MWFVISAEVSFLNYALLYFYKGLEELQIPAPAPRIMEFFLSAIILSSVSCSIVQGSFTS